MTLLSDPQFYMAAIPAVLLFGIAKGGFGGSFGMVSVPLLALVVSPLQAAAILLPILVVMDVFVLRTYWQQFDREALKILLPSAVLGIAVGYWTADLLNEQILRALIGVIAIVFGLQTLLGAKGLTSAKHRWSTGGFWGTVAGFTSYHIHAGGPPFTIYLLPKRLAPLLYAGTAGMFFAVVNAVKLVPYYALDQLAFDNLTLSLILAPLAPIGVAVGHFLVKRTDPKLYYHFISFCLLLIGCKLLWGAMTEFLA